MNSLWFGSEMQQLGDTMDNDFYEAFETEKPELDLLLDDLESVESKQRDVAGSAPAASAASAPPTRASGANKRPRDPKVGDIVSFDFATGQLAKLEQKKMLDYLKMSGLPAELFKVSWKAELPKSRGRSGHGAFGKRKRAPPRVAKEPNYDMRKFVSQETRERRSQGGKKGAFRRWNTAASDINQTRLELDPDSEGLSSNLTQAQLVWQYITEAEDVMSSEECHRALLNNFPNLAAEYGYQHAHLDEVLKTVKEDPVGMNILSRDGMWKGKAPVQGQETEPVPFTGPAQQPDNIKLQCGNMKIVGLEMYKSLLKPYGRVWFYCSFCKKDVAGFDAAKAHVMTTACAKARKAKENRLEDYMAPKGKSIKTFFAAAVDRNLGK